ncbi:hypothetical protein ABC383_20715 [Noviherbaspirillum sp. 1P10PC]|uniref:hypothetical protein n=1 Tax=Noviherbaspirillum sp. 1P10PC TaxID=3132292 RepID=UPI00399F0A25
MRRRHRHLVRNIVACSLLQAFACLAHANVPDGFRGMKWGDPVTRLPNAIAVSNPPGCYGNRREELRLGEAQLFGVLYCFESDRLVRVELRSATGEDNLKAFEEAVTTVFGAPLPPEPGVSRNVRQFTPRDAAVGVTLIREVLGVHKYLLVLESRRTRDSAGEEQGEAKKDFGF